MTSIDDNFIQPFQLDASTFRGRAVCMGDVLNDIMSAHDYPYPVAHMVAEAVTITLLLSTMLKYEGVFTLQAKGDGPVAMIVADITSNGDVRGCASYDADRLEAARVSLQALETPEGSVNHLAQYLGKGHIAFTVDQAGGQDRYQGIVELKGSSLVDCVQHYFAQSEQIATGIKLAAGLRDGVWRSGGIMLQNIPDSDGNAEGAADSNVAEDDWRRSMVFLDSASDDELLSPDLPLGDLLFRLFHEDGVRVYDRQGVQKQCRCDLGRVENVVRSLPDDDVTYLIKDDKIEVSCEFCGELYKLDPADFVKPPA